MPFPDETFKQMVAATDAGGLQIMLQQLQGREEAMQSELVMLKQLEDNSLGGLEPYNRRDDVSVNKWQWSSVGVRSLDKCTLSATLPRHDLAHKLSAVHCN